MEKISVKEGEISLGTRQQTSDRKPVTQSLLSLMMLGYFLVSSRMYGVEAAMGMGPSSSIMLVLLTTPILYVLPLSLIITDCTAA